MKIKNHFFKKKKNISLSSIYKILNIKKISKIQINDIKDLKNATLKDISFFNSLKYLDDFKKTKAKHIIIHKKHLNYINSFSDPIVVDNVLNSVSLVVDLFYPTALFDAVDFTLKKPQKKMYKNISLGKNILIGKNVKIGQNSIIGHNTIIESNVHIGKNCIIGNNVIIKNSLIGNNVRVLDGSVIGKKGFGFLPNKKGNLRYPHIGMVIIYDNVEIGCNNTIDRGSISNTIIGSNTFLDNQVHIAHNVNIGKNCIITGQVGIAGSSSIGDNVMIGGQAGISGHIKIGNNVQIGGGSGVVKNIPDNTRVMGYPARDIKSFLKDNK